MKRQWWDCILFWRTVTIHFPDKVFQVFTLTIHASRLCGCFTFSQKFLPCKTASNWASLSVGTFTSGTSNSPVFTRSATICFEGREKKAASYMSDMWNVMKHRNWKMWSQTMFKPHRLFTSCTPSPTWFFRGDPSGSVWPSPSAVLSRSDGMRHPSTSSSMCSPKQPPPKGREGSVQK